MAISNAVYCIKYALGNATNDNNNDYYINYISIISIIYKLKKMDIEKKINICCNLYCEYLYNGYDNLCHHCEHTKDCQCHESRDTLKKKLDAVKKTERAYRAELSDEISNLIKTNNNLEIALIATYFIISILAALLMLK